MSGVQMSQEKIGPPEFAYGPTVRHDRVGMTGPELCDRALEELQEFCTELDRLHNHLPRKYSDRIRATMARQRVIAECVEGAKGRATVIERAVAMPKEGG